MSEICGVMYADESGFYVCQRIKDHAVLGPEVHRAAGLLWSDDHSVVYRELRPSIQEYRWTPGDKGR